jgi:hypothetical protein
LPTVIVPVICTGWIVQWYGNVPALLNVNQYMSPCSMKPESKTPVSEVAVCVICPLFVQQTVVPTGTVTLAGSKKLSPIEICIEPPGQTDPPPTFIVSVESVDVEPVNPPAATSVPPTAVPDGNERTWFSDGSFCHGQQLIVAPVVIGLRKALPSRPSGRNGLPPPNRYHLPFEATPLPGTLFGVGRFVQAAHVLAAML